MERVQLLFGKLDVDRSTWTSAPTLSLPAGWVAAWTARSRKGAASSALSGEGAGLSRVELKGHADTMTGAVTLRKTQRAPTTPDHCHHRYAAARSGTQR